MLLFLMCQYPIEYETRTPAKPFCLADVSAFWHQLVPESFSDLHGIPDIALLLILYRIWNHAEHLFRSGFAAMSYILFLKKRGFSARLISSLSHYSGFRIILNSLKCLVYFCISGNGGRSSVGRVQDCDSCCRGFEPHRPPQNA